MLRGGFGGFGDSGDSGGSADYALRANPPYGRPGLCFS
jgi:hypothetical protein